MNTGKSQDRIVSSKERRDTIPYSDMHVWRLEQDGLFPKRIRLGANRVGWSERELQQWIAARKAERTETQDEDEDEVQPWQGRGRNSQDAPSQTPEDDDENDRDDGIEVSS